MERIKIINLLVKIANNLLEDGTKVIFNDELYFYNKKRKRLENKEMYRLIDIRELNNFVEIISPKKGS